MKLQELLTSLTVRFENGEGHFEVQTRNERGQFSPTRLLIQTDKRREIIHIDAWERQP